MKVNTKKAQSKWLCAIFYCWFRFILVKLTKISRNA